MEDHPFRGWYLPESFSLMEGEVSPSKGPGGRSLVLASLSPGRIRDLVKELRRERESLLASLPVARIIGAVDGVAVRFLNAGDPLRERAREELRDFAGYSRQMAEAVLEGMARSWTRDALETLLESEFKDPGVLDGFRRRPEGGWVRALGFPLVFHLGAGTVPGVSVTSLIRGLLVKSACLLKPGFGDLPLPVLFAQALQEADPDLARGLAVVYWPSHEEEKTEAALAEADLAVAYGSDRTVGWIREKLPPTTPLLPYRHRMGFGLVGVQGLRRHDSSVPSECQARSTAFAAARSIALFDQKGCVSPHVFFVERGGEVGPEAWFDLLAEGLGELASVLPSGRVSTAEGAAIQQLRGIGEMAEGAGEARVRHGGTDSPWTVLFLPGDSEIQLSCSHRTISVIPVDNLFQALGRIRPWAPFLQTIGAAGLGEDAGEVLEALARLGVSRVARLESVPWPEAWWHHDGTSPLLDLVRWMDVEERPDLRSDIAEE